MGDRKYYISKFHKINRIENGHISECRYLYLTDSYGVNYDRKFLFLKERDRTSLAFMYEENGEIYEFFTGKKFDIFFLYGVRCATLPKTNLRIVVDNFSVEEDTKHYRLEKSQSEFASEIRPYAECRKRNKRNVEKLLAQAHQDYQKIENLREKKRIEEEKKAKKLQADAEWLNKNFK